jgi:hypothetical protein
LLEERNRSWSWQTYFLLSLRPGKIWSSLLPSLQRGFQRNRASVLAILSFRLHRYRSGLPETECLRQGGWLCPLGQEEMRKKKQPRLWVERAHLVSQMQEKFPQCGLLCLFARLQRRDDWCRSFLPEIVLQQRRRSCFNLCRRLVIRRRTLLPQVSWEILLSWPCLLAIVPRWQ